MKKTFIITSMAAFAALCFSLTAQAQGPAVVSDKDDYAPGETAMFSAAGFQPNELLDFSVAVQDDQGLWVPDIAWADVPADASGGAEVDYVVPQSWANKTLQLTVMGLSSGLMATTTFTDAAAANINFATSGLGVVTSIHITGTCTNNGGMPAPINEMFNSPGPSGNTGVQPNSSFTYTGFPAMVAGVGGHYELDHYSQDSPATAGDGQTVTTVTAYYNFVPDGTPNSTPVVTPESNVSVDLGQIAGCSGEGPDGGFGKSVAVAYSVEEVDSMHFNVNATFNGGNQTRIGTVFDADGNLPIGNITTTPATQTLTFGPGSSTMSFSTSVTATDSLGAVGGPTTCPTVGNVTAQIIYNFNGFFSPLSNVATTKVKRGSGVPVKFQVFDCDGVTPITTGDFTIRVTKLSGITPAGLDIDDAGFSGDDGINFRYDPTGMQWIFNLKTNSTYDLGCTYLIWADLGDGVDHNVAISIK